VYKPTVINVNCDGTGTPLADTLDRLNPTAAVYDIVISGTCTERVVLKNFSSLTLRSDATNPASIGPVYVDNGNNLVLISNLEIRWDGQLNGDVQAAVAKPSVGRLTLQDISFVCTATSGEFPCYMVVSMQGAGDLRVYRGAVSGADWRNPTVSLNRGGTAIVAANGGDPCLPYSYRAIYGSTIRVVNNSGSCNSGSTSVTSEYGSMVYVEGPLYSPGDFLAVTARAGQVYRAGVSGGGWYSSIQCFGSAAVVEDTSFAGNLCP
jgi:hypothetical protein